MTTTNIDTALRRRKILTVILILSLSISIIVIAIFQMKFSLLEKLFMLLTTILLHFNIYYIFLRQTDDTIRSNYLDKEFLSTPI